MAIRRQTQEVWQDTCPFFRILGILKGRLASDSNGQVHCRKEPPGDYPVLSRESGPVADILESFCRGRVLAVDMIGSNGNMETEGDILASAEGILCARGVIGMINKLLGPEIGPEKENKRCTGVAG